MKRDKGVYRAFNEDSSDSIRCLGLVYEAPEGGQPESNAGAEFARQLFFSISKSKETGMLIGFPHLQFIDDFETFGWELGKDYTNSPITIDQEYYGTSDDYPGLFFQRPPPNWADVWYRFDMLRLYQFDSIALFLNYRGPADLHKIPSLVEPSELELEIFQPVLQFCDGILTFVFDGDGLSFTCLPLPESPPPD